MKRLIFAAALVALWACGDAVGEVMQDAGTMLTDAGGILSDAAVPDAGADFDVTCDKSAQHPDVPTGWILHWAEFPVNPGQTEVTICTKGRVDLFGYWLRDACHRSKAGWFHGTSTGFVQCGIETEGQFFALPISVTIHD